MLPAGRWDVLPGPRGAARPSPRCVCVCRWGVAVVGRTRPVETEQRFELKRCNDSDGSSQRRAEQKELEKACERRTALLVDTETTCRPDAEPVRTSTCHQNGPADPRGAALLRVEEERAFGQGGAPTADDRVPRTGQVDGLDLRQLSLEGDRERGRRKERNAGQTGAPAATPCRGVEGTWAGSGRGGDRGSPEAEVSCRGHR